MREKYFYEKPGTWEELYFFFARSGRDGQGTLKFCNVEIEKVDSEERIHFTYVSESTGDKRQAIFDLNHVVGVSAT